MGLNMKDRDIVVPGDVIATGMDYLPSDGCYRSNDSIIANRLGLLRVEGKVVKSIPLSGAYLPKRNDVIVGKVIDILMSGWRIEINSPYSAVLNMKDASFDFINKTADLSKIFGLGDWIVAKIVNVTSQNLVDVSCKGSGLRKLVGGRLLEVNPRKVPRIIGKKGSMVSMLKKALDCRINVGQNGWVWIDGKPEDEIIAEETIKMIEEESHLPGLTQKVADFLKKKKPGVELELPENDNNGGEE
jgi:exosome complex component RRP4